MITDARLEVRDMPGHPGRRRLAVSYDLVIAPEDRLVDQTIVEHALVHARDMHDAPTSAALTNLAELTGTFEPVGAVVHRELVADVHRIDLDVQQDWWDTDHGGGVVPIAEFPDHLQAELELTTNGRIVARASTPILTGSWGALGRD